jgi:hypothetical protein
MDDAYLSEYWDHAVELVLMSLSFLDRWETIGEESGMDLELIHFQMATAIWDSIELTFHMAKGCDQFLWDLNVPQLLRLKCTNNVVWSCRCTTLLQGRFMKVNGRKERKTVGVYIRLKVGHNGQVG